MGLKKFELIELEKSLKKAELPEEIEGLKQKYVKWTKEAKELKEKYLYDYDLSAPEDEFAMSGAMVDEL